MRLIPAEFGLRTGDPVVPGLEFTALYKDEELNVTVGCWSAFLPWEADDSSGSDVLFEWRAEATVEHAEVAATVEYPWAVTVRVNAAGVTVSVTVNGPFGWNEVIRSVDRFALDARADEIATAAWAVWHATGQAGDADEVAGILWLVGARFDWASAVQVAAALAAA